MPAIYRSGKHGLIENRVICSALCRTSSKRGRYAMHHCGAALKNPCDAQLFGHYPVDRHRKKRRERLFTSKLRVMPWVTRCQEPPWFAAEGSADPSFRFFRLIRIRGTLEDRTCLLRLVATRA